MGNYKFKEESRKRTLDHNIISAMLKKEIKLHIFGLVVIFGLWMLLFFINWLDFSGYGVLVICIIGALIALFAGDVIYRTVKIAKRKYVVEIDTVIEIRENDLVSTAGRRPRIRDILRFRNNGDYMLHNKNILEYTEVGDTFYVVRYEKKQNKKRNQLTAVYSTKKYEWKE